MSFCATDWYFRVHYANIGRIGGRIFVSMSGFVGKIICSVLSSLISMVNTCVVPFKELIITVSLQPLENSPGFEN
jgi:hypothetical protein